MMHPVNCINVSKEIPPWNFGVPAGIFAKHHKTWDAEIKE